MSTLLLDDVGLCLLRRLVEAHEAWRVSVDHMKIERDPQSNPRSIARHHHHEAIERNIEYEDLLADFLEHLTFMPSPALDVSHYAHLWAHMQTLPEDERNMGRLFDVGQDIGQKAIDMYREMER